MKVCLESVVLILASSSLLLYRLIQIMLIHGYLIVGSDGDSLLIPMLNVM